MEILCEVLNYENSTLHVLLEWSNAWSLTNFSFVDQIGTGGKNLFWDLGYSCVVCLYIIPLSGLCVFLSCYRISSYLCFHIHTTFKWLGKFAVSNECPQDWPAQLMHDQMHSQAHKDSGAYFLQVNEFSSELLLKNMLLKYSCLSQ